MISALMSKLWIVGLMVAVVISAWADHPNEGSLAIEQLIKHAESNNLDLKQIEFNLKAAQADLFSKRGRYYPQFSLEGGYLTSRVSQENHSGVFLFGKAEWNLFRGGADDVQIKQTGLNLDLEELKAKALKLKIKNEVSKVYYEMLFILESIALKERALSFNAEQMKLAVAKRNSGFTSQTDVLEFELRESTLRSDLLLLQQDREIKSKELALLLGSSTPETFFAIKGHLHRSSVKPNFSQMLEQLRKNNKELRESELLVKTLDYDKRRVVADFLPQLDLEAQYGRLAEGERVSDGNHNYSVMLKLSIPLFSGLETYYAHQFVQSTLQARHLKKIKQSQDVEIELEKTLSSIQILNHRLDLEEKNLSRSETYYKMTLSEYRRGVKNSPDMVGATERLLEARIRNLEYRRDLALSLLKVKDLVGEE